MQQKKNAFKAKLLGFNQLKKMLKVMQEERENILKIKNFSSDGKLPRGLLS